MAQLHNYQEMQQHQEEMKNLTKYRNYKKTEELFCVTDLYEPHQKIILSAFNIPLSITAFLGNVLILVALQKPSSLHPPSKVLLGCLVSTDLCVGLFTQPVYVIFLLSPKHSKHCYYSVTLSNTIRTLFCAISLLTVTAISVDRLLTLLLGLRYKLVVTLRRVWLLVATFWFCSITLVATIFYNSPISHSVAIASTITLLCLMTSTFCYIKIFLTLRHHQAQVQGHVNQLKGDPHEGGIPFNIARYRKAVSRPVHCGYR